MFKRAILWSATASVSVLGLCTAAYAQADAATGTEPETSDRTLEEIVVTARKRSESLIRVPVAVAAFSTEEIERANITDLSRMVQITPGLKVTSGSMGTAFTIRGIGSTTLDPGLEQSVALNIDGINAGRALIGSLGLFDVQQIEILKGPQALFFGKNSPSGVIAVRTASPNNVIEGFARAGYEFNARERYLEAAVGGPITSRLGVRVAGRATHMDGWIQNRATAKPNPFQPAYPFPGAWSDRFPARKNLLGRVTIVWEPADRLVFTLKATGSRYRDNSSGAEQQAICAGPFPITYGVPDPEGDCRPDAIVPISAAPEAIDATFPHARGRPYTVRNSELVSLNVDYALGAISLNSVTGYYHIYNDEFASNYEASTIGNIHAYNGERTRYFTQELRASTDFELPVNFTIGAYFEDGQRTAINDAQIAPVGPDPVTGKFQSAERVARVRSKAYSLFGQATWDITEELELSGGARWTKESKQIVARNTYVHGLLGAVFLPTNVELNGSNDEDNISPELTLTWHPNSTSTLYMAYKTGYKSGGFANPPLLTAGFTDLSRITFGAEESDGAEFGYKAMLFDNSLRLEATLYSYRYKGLQLSSFDASTVSYRIRNAASARTKGVDLEATWRATPELTLKGALNYTHARYTDFTTAPCFGGQTAAEGCIGGTRSLTGEPLDRAPNWSTNLGFNYEVPISSGLTLGLNGDTAYSGSYFTNQNHAPLSRQKSYWLLGAGLRVRSEQGWELSLLGRNLTNKFYLQNSSDRPGGQPGDQVSTLPRPREVILQAAYRF